MQLKVDSVEKQLKSNKQFLEVKLYFHVFSSLCSECFNVVMVINRLKIHFPSKPTFYFDLVFQYYCRFPHPDPSTSPLILLDYLLIHVFVYFVLQLFSSLRCLSLHFRMLNHAGIRFISQVLLNKFSVPKENESKLKKTKVIVN